MKPFAERFCDAWNEVAVEHGLKRCVTKTTLRDKWRVRQIGKCRLLSCEVEDWKAGFQEVAGNPWMAGQNDRGWKAGLEYVLRDQNIARILEDGILAREEAQIKSQKNEEWEERERKRLEEAKRRQGRY